MNYAAIKKTDIANGEGVRVSLFVSGCRNHCKGCFNAETQDFNFGKPFSEETEAEIFAALAPDYIAGLSVLGGEPFEEENQTVLAPFLSRVKSAFPQKNIWCYTGYIYESDILSERGRKHTAFTAQMLDTIDVLVDGPFIEAEKDLTLNFRGSRNQRIIRLAKKCK